MIHSMTGFASLTKEEDSATIGVTLRAVNHRYLDLQIRLPHLVAELEPRLRTTLQRRLTRGRIELTVSVQLRQTPAIEVELNETFTKALSDALEKARGQGLVAGTLTPGDLIRFPQAIAIRERPAGADEAVSGATAAVERAVDEALSELERMRALEGEHLRADLDTHRAILADLIHRLERAAEQGRLGLESRLADRIRELRVDPQVDQVTIAQEVVRFASRSDISEEVARFRGHLTHWDVLADSPEPCGRKLDFLLQEMNREINTIGSKADGLQVSELIIEAKAGLERLREQVQNVE